MLHFRRRAKAVLADVIDFVAWRFGYRVTAMATSDLPGIDSFWINPWPAYLGRPFRPQRLRPRTVTGDLFGETCDTFLTAGIDVSDHRVEIELIGWGRSGELWSLGHPMTDDGSLDAASSSASITPFRR